MILFEVYIQFRYEEPRQNNESVENMLYVRPSRILEAMAKIIVAEVINWPKTKTGKQISFEVIT